MNDYKNIILYLNEQNYKCIILKPFDKQVDETLLVTFNYTNHIVYVLSFEMDAQTVDFGNMCKISSNLTVGYTCRLSYEEFSNEKVMRIFESIKEDVIKIGKTDFWDDGMRVQEIFSEPLKTVDEFIEQHHNRYYKSNL